jgi:hypothetical protein
MQPYPLQAIRGIIKAGHPPAHRTNQESDPGSKLQAKGQREDEKENLRYPSPPLRALSRRNTHVRSFRCLSLHGLSIEEARHFVRVHFVWDFISTIRLPLHSQRSVGLDPLKQL